MPQKKGAPARATTPRTGSGRAAAPKAGSRSPKHRGYRPEEAESTPKKARWNAEERAAKGRATERPRGAQTRPQRARVEDAREIADRARQGRDTRPSWEPREKRSRYEERTERFERRTERFGGERSRADRPARFARDDRPARDDRYDRPARTDRFPRDDRPARFARDDRPARHDRDDRPARDDRSAARPPRPAREMQDDARRVAPGARRAGRDTREAPAFLPDRAERGGRPGRDARPARAPRGEDRAPRHERDAEAPRYTAPEDVVLERLAATAIDATDLDGATFEGLGLGQNIVRALAELGAERPFPIQAGTIPAVLSGRDVLGRGRTGSGKTIAFGAPLVERLLQLQAGDAKRRQPGRAPRALILAPTRELALQIDATVQPLARSVGLFTTQIYGGVPYQRQLGALERGVDIVIGTPGRIQDLSAQGRLNLSRVVVTVLDEADHMCELGFLEPVQEILDRTSTGGQKLLFSATLDSGVASIVDKYLVDPSVHEVAGEDQASGTIEHRVLLLDQRDKLEVLAELAQGEGRKLVFARTRAFAEQLADFLDEAGIDADAIHGDLNQSRRQRALDRFAKGRTTVLVATDVAARGIHVDDVGLVIQADAPDEYKSYLHRSGRTGRAGKTGVVVTLVPRSRRRRTEELLARAEIEAEWTQVRPGDAILADLAG